MSANPPAGAGYPRPGAGSFQTVRFPVAGMTCGSCVNRITRALKRLDGVERVRVDLGRELVTVHRNPSIASDAVLAAAIAVAGYVADLDASVRVPDTELRGPLARLFRARRGDR